MRILLSGSSNFGGPMPANHCVPHTLEARAKMRAARIGKPAPWKRRKTRAFFGVVVYRCSRCRLFFDRDGFYANKRTLFGLKSECRRCHGATSIASRDPEATRARSRVDEANRRARLAGSPGRITASILANLANLLGRSCLCCKSREELQWDHIVPIARGGIHHPRNLQPLCRKCNERKHTATIDYRSDEQRAAVANVWVIEFNRVPA